MILMHSRGVPATMNGLTTYKNGVITGVCDEMTDIFRKADEYIPRWLQIADFGIGFAKTSEQNFQLLNPSNMKTMKANIGDRPLLVGVSRKRFLGMGEFDNMEVRDWGTAGACSAAVLGSANILRVHNVKGIRSACRVFRRCIEGI
jgi:dihydropteroate synthase